MKEIIEHPVSNGDIMAFLGLLITIIIGYAKLMTRIRELEVRVQMVEHKDDKILDTLNEIREDITEIKVDFAREKGRA